jgi:hypothetical protein
MTTATIHDHADALRADCQRLPDGPTRDALRRRLLVPFAGAGSEMIGALLAGWEHIEGVELMEDHTRIAAARLAYWQQRAGEFAGGKPITVKAARKAPAGQRSLFEDEAA